MLIKGHVYNRTAAATTQNKSYWWLFHPISAIYSIKNSIPKFDTGLIFRGNNGRFAQTFHWCNKADEHPSVDTFITAGSNLTPHPFYFLPDFTADLTSIKCLYWNRGHLQWRCIPEGTFNQNIEP